MKNKIVLTNGVFDLLHAGHIEILKKCKELGTYLIVAIDSDERVKKIKGKSRPIYSEKERKFILESIKYVDEVVIFNSIEELNELHKKCDILVKGNEFSEDMLRIKDNVISNVEIVLFDKIGKYSTTNTIKNIERILTP